VIFCECLLALIAAEALEAVSMFAESLARDPAAMARHSIYLDLSVKASQNGD
jgi:hypothetical protein